MDTEIVNTGNRIKTLRSEKKLTQKDLASVLEVTTNTIYNYEQNRIEIPAIYLIKMSRYFNVTVDYLLCLTDLKNENDSLLDRYDIEREFNKLNNLSKEKVIFYLEVLLANQNSASKKRKKDK